MTRDEDIIRYAADMNAPVTRAEVAEYFDITPNWAGDKLSALVRDGYMHFAGFIETPGRGKNPRLYDITHDGRVEIGEEI